jgi:hypothetical protein
MPLYITLHHLLNALVQIANKVGNYKKKVYLSVPNSLMDRPNYDFSLVFLFSMSHFSFHFHRYLCNVTCM